MQEMAKEMANVLPDKPIFSTYSLPLLPDNVNDEDFNLPIPRRDELLELNQLSITEDATHDTTTTVDDQPCSELLRYGHLIEHTVGDYPFTEYQEAPGTTSCMAWHLGNDGSHAIMASKLHKLTMLYLGMFHVRLSG